jgi:tRNA A37 threonylcarbamoyladenosine modification protein TsaB
MYKLFIDTTSRENRKVTLYKDTEIVQELVGELDIVIAIKSILDKNNLTLKDIQEFSANPGPGSFTGIKIGITISNILNWALNKKNISQLQKPEYGSEPNVTRPKNEI